MIINKRVIIGAIIVATILVLYGVLALNGYTYQKSTSSRATACMTVIAADVIPTVDTALMFITPTATIDPAIGDLGGVSVGKYVQIKGTGGVGLNVRGMAGKDTSAIFIADESEVFLVIGGPDLKDDIIWWQIAAPYEDARQGWAAADYLSVIEE
jgi:hypothetical protein